MGERLDLDTLVLRVVDLLGASRHLRLGAAIEHHGPCGAEAQRGADRVERGVAAADHGHVLPAAVVDRLVVLGKAVRLHQVHAGEELVGGVDAVQVLARDVEELRQARSGRDEDGVVALLLHQLVDRDAASDDHVRLEADAHLLQVADFPAHDVLREPKLGDAVDEHAADLVERLEHGDVVALLHQVAGGSERGGAAAHAGDPLPAGGRARRQTELARLRLPVGDEAFEVADRERAELPAHHAGALALVLLRADAPGDRGQHVVLAHLGCRGAVVPLEHELDELADLDPDRAALLAGRLLALDAAQGFGPGLRRIEAQVDLLEVRAPHGRRLLRHDPARDLDPGLHRQRVRHAPFSAPARRPSGGTGCAASAFASRRQSCRSAKSRPGQSRKPRSARSSASRYIALRLARLAKSTA